MGYGGDVGPPGAPQAQGGSLLSRRALLSGADPAAQPSGVLRESAVREE